MPPQRHVQCQICQSNVSKYSCSKCLVLYCSVPCYKQHKGTACSTSEASQSIPPDTPASPEKPAGSIATDEGGAQEQITLRPLTSLNWPYVPEESAYPDPLKRDDPKALQLCQYEAIATSSAIREVLTSHPRLRDIMTSIDRMRGTEREDALQRALGVASVDSRPDAVLEGLGKVPAGDIGYGGEDKHAFRALAEAVEAAVRGGQEGLLGLDWDES
ncbi:hypothetical protein BV25DRAFT_1868308 [Artomyces pyxidatus]|uniref:Uncharacterized protein n=2 Tax=Artomyces pyxidatus TaxID=48021 RepID=A0ACB8SNX5_9AGAM|nr:hypothetical protein BV25DRAFT_1872193 [Artomyces pyxidatus]KAI0065994.1 hypothetical protein BV25DRAFT_1868308 [Artomyces pyxidatus]